MTKFEWHTVIKVHCLLERYPFLVNCKDLRFIFLTTEVSLFCWLVTSCIYNETKTKVMTITPRCMKSLYIPKFISGDQEIDVCREEKYLGCILLNNLCDDVDIKIKKRLEIFMCEENTVGYIWGGYQGGSGIVLSYPLYVLSWYQHFFQSLLYFHSFSNYGWFPGMMQINK